MMNFIDDVKQYLRYNISIYYWYSAFGGLCIIGFLWMVTSQPSISQFGVFLLLSFPWGVAYLLYGLVQSDRFRKSLDRFANTQEYDIRGIHIHLEGRKKNLAWYIAVFAFLFVACLAFYLFQNFKTDDTPFITRDQQAFLGFLLAMGFHCFINLVMQLLLQYQTGLVLARIRNP